MLRKIFLSIFLIFIVLYSCTWFYASVHYKKLIIKSIERLNSSNINFSYDKLSVKNFPLSPTILIDNPKLAFTNQNQTNSYKLNKLKIVSNLLLNKFIFQTSKDIEHETKDQNFITKYNKPIEIYIEFHKTLLFKNLADNLSMAKLLKSINYNIQDFIILDQNSHIISKHEYSKFSLAHDISNFNHSLKLNVDVKGLSANEINELLPQELNIDAGLTLKSNPKNVQEFIEYDINFEHLYFNFEKFSFSLTGKAKGTEEDILPSGEIKIAIGKLTNLLSYLSTNNIIHNEDKILSIVEQTADTHNDSETYLTIKRDKGGKFYLGPLTFSHILFSLLGN